LYSAPFQECASIVIKEEPTVFNVLTVYQLADASLPIETADPFAAVMLPIVLVVGFLAAAGIGSIAWYNSKRPAGWDSKERPDIVPEVDTFSNPEP
jgi:hypothetical protein